MFVWGWDLFPDPIPSALILNLVSFQPPVSVYVDVTSCVDHLQSLGKTALHWIRSLTFTEPPFPTHLLTALWRWAVLPAECVQWISRALEANGLAGQTDNKEAR